MSVSLTDLLRGVNRYLKYTDALNLIEEDREEIIRDSLNIYSKRRPFLSIASEIGNADAIYDLPVAFEDNFSIIGEIEYPIEKKPKEIIESKYWFIDTMIEGKKLRFDEYNPTAGQTFWIRFTVRHSFGSDNVSETVPSADREGLIFLATALTCYALADHFAGKADANLPAVDIVGYPTRPSEWSSAGDRWMEKYKDEISQKINDLYGDIDFLENAYFDRNNE